MHVGFTLFYRHKVKIKLSQFSLLIVFSAFPDDVYRRKKSEREYQQKITDGLVVPTEPAGK